MPAAPIPPPSPHRKALMGLGFLISNLVGLFIGAFFFPSFWATGLDNGEVSLVIIGLISLVTLVSAIASYFWSLAGIPLGRIRTLAIPNASIPWFFIVFHPLLGKDLFFVVFAALIILFCSILGSWFGRRVFYE